MTIKTTNKNKIKLLGKEKTKAMKKNILHNSYKKLSLILKYKCAINEIYFSEVNPKNTSKDCSNCGNTKTEEEQNLSDRDYNSVLNILNIGIK